MLLSSQLPCFEWELVHYHTSFCGRWWSLLKAAAFFQWLTDMQLRWCRFSSVPIRKKANERKYRKLRQKKKEKENLRFRVINHIHIHIFVCVQYFSILIFVTHYLSNGLMYHFLTAHISQIWLINWWYYYMPMKHQYEVSITYIRLWMFYISL